MKKIYLLNNNKLAVPDRELEGGFALPAIVAPVQPGPQDGKVHLDRFWLFIEAVNGRNVDVGVARAPANRIGYRVAYLGLLAVDVVDFFLCHTLCLFPLPVPLMSGTNYRLCGYSLSINSIIRCFSLK